MRRITSLTSGRWPVLVAVVIAEGDVEKIKSVKESITGQYLSREKFIPVPAKRRHGTGNFVEVIGAAENNLANIRVKFPLGVFTAVTGVSAAARVHWVNEILFKGPWRPSSTVARASRDA